MAMGGTISHNARVSCTGHVQLISITFSHLENVHRSVYSKIVKREGKLRIHSWFMCLGDRLIVV